MARMRTGRRLTPQTTDPQGNRIADPDVFGKKINSNQTVSSWPKVREMYKSGQLNESLKGRPLNPEVKRYLEGEVNTLDDKEFEEPILSKMNNGVKEYTDLGTFYRKGGKNYARVEKTTGRQSSKAGEMNYYDSSQTAKNVNDWKSSGAGGGEDLNRYRTKPGEFTPEPKKPEPPKADDLTLDKMPILKPGKIDIKKRSIKGKREEVNEKQDFVSPGKPVRRGKSPDMNLFAKGATTKGSGKRYVKQVIGSIGKTGDNSRGYNREEKLFKAKASTGAANTDFSDLSSKEIKGIRKDYLKKDLQTARRDTNLKPEDRAKQIAAAKMDIKQSRGAQRYSKKMEKGNLSYFTPGYNEGKNKNEDVIDKRGRIAEYKYSQDNATNRNTIDTKLKAIGEKAKTNASKRATTTIGGFEYNRMD